MSPTPPARPPKAPKTQLLRALARNTRALDLPGRRVLVAVSGGLDSSVLLHGLQRLAVELGLGLAAAHVHHGLRGADADAEQAAAAALAGALGVPFRTARVDPEALRRGRASRARPTLQEAARRARYDALAALRAAAGADVIATAHHADDQAETVLLRLLRGAGPDGLGGIPERSPDGRVVRPLLDVPRDALRAYAEAHGLRWCDDPSNADPRFARSRLRHRWLPGLAEAFNPRLLRAIADLAEAQRRDAEWIEAVVDELARTRLRPSGEGLRLTARGWDDLPEGLARRLARRALVRSGAGRDVSRRHLERCLSFLRSGRPGTAIQLPGGLELARGSAEFRLGPARGVRGRGGTAC